MLLVRGVVMPEALALPRVLERDMAVRSLVFTLARRIAALKQSA